jgi:hypothetical protein
MSRSKTAAFRPLAIRHSEALKNQRLEQSVQSALESKNPVLAVLIRQVKHAWRLGRQQGLATRLQHIYGHVMCDSGELRQKLFQGIARLQIVKQRLHRYTRAHKARCAAHEQGVLRDVRAGQVGLSMLFVQCN